MFTLNKEKAYFWPVKFCVPGENGAVNDQSFEGQFKRLKNSEIQDIIENYNVSKDKKYSDLEIAKRVIVGWKGITEEDGTTEHKFTAANLTHILEVPQLAGAITVAFMRSIKEGMDYIRKN